MRIGKRKKIEKRNRKELKQIKEEIGEKKEERRGGKSKRGRQEDK